MLGVLYESYVHPITILSTLPSAGVGAMLALMLFHTEFDIIALIGVILLIGIVKKNAIMMVDFALDCRARGRQKSTSGSHLRGLHTALPPDHDDDDGSHFRCLAPSLRALEWARELRRPLGITIVGGLIPSQLITLYTTPVVYLALDGLRQWSLRQRQRLFPGLFGAPSAG